MDIRQIKETIAQAKKLNMVPLVVVLPVSHEFLMDADGADEYITELVGDSVRRMVREYRAEHEA